MTEIIIIPSSLATFFQVWHTVEYFLSLAKSRIPLLDNFYSPSSVWHTRGNGSIHNTSLRKYPTGPYPPVLTTIQPVSTLWLYYWWKRAYTFIFQYQFLAILVLFGHPAWSWFVSMSNLYHFLLLLIIQAHLVFSFFSIEPSIIESLSVTIV